MNELVRINGVNVSVFVSSEAVRDAIALWLAGLSSGGTRKAYFWEIQQFAKFAGHDDVSEAAAAFLRLDGGPAHAVADAWRASKIAAGKSPASVNRSMATLNSFVASAKRHGLTQLTLKAQSEKAQRYRDTAGCGVAGFQKLLDEAKSQTDAHKAARDTAILRLAFGLGLRRNEIASLDIGHIDLGAKKVHVLGKGSRERVTLTLPMHALDALSTWIELRRGAGSTEPLFTNLAHNGGGARISGSGVYHLIRDQLGGRAKVKVRPHGIRHTAITAAIDAFGGDYRKARAFSRHASLETVRKYDDNRADHAGQVAAVIDGLAD